MVSTALAHPAAWSNYPNLKEEEFMFSNECHVETVPTLHLLIIDQKVWTIQWNKPHRLLKNIIPRNNVSLEIGDLEVSLWEFFHHRQTLQWCLRPCLIQLPKLSQGLQGAWNGSLQPCRLSLGLWHLHHSQLQHCPECLWALATLLTGTCSSSGVLGRCHLSLCDFIIFFPN